MEKEQFYEYIKTSDNNNSNSDTANTLDVVEAEDTEPKEAETENIDLESIFKPETEKDFLQQAVEDIRARPLDDD